MPYDGDLNQIIESPRTLDIDALMFHRWLFTHGYYDQDAPTNIDWRVQEHAMFSAAMREVQ